MARRGHPIGASPSVASIPGWEYYQRLSQAWSSALLAQAEAYNEAWPKIREGNYELKDAIKTCANVIERYYDAVPRAAARVETIHGLLRDGACYQVNLTRRLEFDRAPEPHALFGAVVAANPAPYAALCTFGAALPGVIGCAERLWTLKLAWSGPISP